MKLNRCLILGALLSIPLLGAANGPWYVGLGVGPASLLNYSHVQADGTLGDVRYGGFGAVGSLFAGYTYHIKNHFNLGGEIFGNGYAVKYNNDNHMEPTHTAKLQYAYGLRVLPEYQVDSAASLHAIFGFTRGNFKSTWNGDTDISCLNGFQVGLGGKLKLTPHIGLRGDLIYSKYKNNSMTLDSYPFKNRFSTFDGIISVFYNFA